jgi:hypothetical protein
MQELVRTGQISHNSSVEKGMDGFSLGQQIKDKLGMRASATAELVFENVLRPRVKCCRPGEWSNSLHDEEFGDRTRRSSSHGTRYRTSLYRRNEALCWRKNCLWL